MAVCSTSLKCITCKSTTISNRIMQNTILPCFFFLALSLLGFFTGLRFTDTGRAAEHVLMEYNINGRVHVFIYGSSIYTHRPSCRACPPFATPCLWECHMSEKWGRVLCHAMRDKWRMHLASTSEASESRLSMEEGRKCIGGERRCELHILSPHIQIACHICITRWRLIFDDVMHFATHNGYACCFALCVGLSVRGIFSISSTISIVSYPKKILSNKTNYQNRK
jgi:hypothetical protein